MGKGLAIGLAIGLAMLFLLIPLASAQEEVCEFPGDYASKNDVSVLTDYYASLKDDSESTRRMIEINTRKLDELQARQWASSGEVENLSKATNASIMNLREATALKFEQFEGVMVGRIQTVKVESILLLMTAVFSLFVMSNWLYGSKYRELEKKMGVFPRRVPMTTKEKGLEARVIELERMLEREIEKDEVSPSRFKEALGALVRIAGLVVGACLLVVALFVVLVLAGVL